MHPYRHLFRSIVLAPCLSQLVWAGETLSLPALLLKARETNPDIATARQTWQVKQAQIGPAGAWPNPVLSYSHENSVMGDPGSAQQKVDRYRVEQMIPFPGKLSHEAQMKYHDALIAQAEYRAKMIEVLRDVRMRYFQLYLTEEQIRLAQESVEILNNALKTAQARLASGQSSASDVFMAQTELAQMNNDLLEQEAQRQLVEIELNTLLNEPTERSYGPAQAPDLEDIPASLEDLEKLAKTNDPEYLTAIHEIRHATAMRTLSRLAFVPDFGVMYELDKSPERPDGRMVGVSVSLPLWVTRPWGERRAAIEHVKEAEALSQSIENRVMRLLHREYIETGTRLILARNDKTRVIPSALASLRVAREQYASGQGDFLRLLEAYRTWIRANNTYEEQLYAYAEHWTELERWVGVDLNQSKEALDLLKGKPMDEEMNHGK